MIMGSPCSGVAMAIKPMLEQEGMPWIGISANPKITTPPVAGHVPRHLHRHPVRPRHGELRHEQARGDQDRPGRAQQRLGARLLRSRHRLHQEAWRPDRRHHGDGARLHRRHRAGAADQGLRRPGRDGLPLSAGAGDLPARHAEIQRGRVHRRPRSAPISSRPSATSAIPTRCAAGSSSPTSSRRSSARAR